MVGTHAPGIAVWVEERRERNGEVVRCLCVANHADELVVGGSAGGAALVPVGVEPGVCDAGEVPSEASEQINERVNTPGLQLSVQSGPHQVTIISSELTPACTTALSIDLNASALLGPNWLADHSPVPNT